MNFTTEPVISFSMDTDWVDDETLEWSLKIFLDRGLPVTVFATHETPVLKNPPEGVEVGIHPNFFTEPNHEKAVADLMSIYPQATGVRSHGLFEYSNLMNVYKKLGLKWDSSQQLYLCSHLRPYRHPSGLMRLPIFWEDDDYFSLEPDWNVEGLKLTEPGVKVFDFHPIHLRLNSTSSKQYVEAKKSGFSEEALEKATCADKDKGVRNLFDSLCDYIEKRRLNVAGLGEICSWV